MSIKLSFFGWSPTYRDTTVGKSPLDSVGTLAFQRTHAPLMNDVAGFGGIIAGQPYGCTFQPVIFPAKTSPYGDVGGYGLGNSYNDGRGLYELAVDQKGKIGI